jgi:hypothetical protein
VKRPTRASEAGRAYLDLQNRARAERRGTQQLLTLYVVERWLARLSASPHADKFVIKGGMLLAAYDARRPTADLDSMIATATVRFRLDVNFGDPVTPAPGLVTIPSLRSGLASLRVLGYPVETVLAEKIATAIALGPANTRVRDYADIYALTGRHTLTRSMARSALLATTGYRDTPLQRLSDAIGNFADLRQQTFAAYRSNLGGVGLLLPADLAEVVTAATAFADPLASTDAVEGTWLPAKRLWTWR